MDKVSNDLSSINFDDLESLLGSDDNLEFNMDTDYSDLSSSEPSNEITEFYWEDITDLSNNDDYSFGTDYSSLDLSNLTESSNNNNTNNNSNQNNNGREYIDLNKYFEQLNLNDTKEQNGESIYSPNNNSLSTNFNSFISEIQSEYQKLLEQNYFKNLTSNPQTSNDFGETHHVGTLIVPGLPGEFDFKNPSTYYSISNPYNNNYNHNNKTTFNDLIDFQKNMAEKYYNLALDQFNEKKREFDEMLKLQQQLIDQKNQEIQLGWQYYNMSLEQWKTKLGEIQHLQQVRKINNDRFLSGD